MKMVASLLISVVSLYDIADLKCDSANVTVFSLFTCRGTLRDILKRNFTNILYIGLLLDMDF